MKLCRAKWKIQLILHASKNGHSPENGNQNTHALGEIRVSFQFCVHIFFLFFLPCLCGKHPPSPQITIHMMFCLQRKFTPLNGHSPENGNRNTHALGKIRVSFQFCVHIFLPFFLPYLCGKRPPSLQITIHMMFCL